MLTLAKWRLVSDRIRAIVALGRFAWQVALRLAGASAPGGRGSATASLPSWEPVCGC